jgi:hypothetical protein
MIEIEITQYSNNLQKRGGEDMKKLVIFAVVAMALLVPTMAGFAERDDVGRIGSVEVQL